MKPRAVKFFCSLSLAFLFALASGSAMAQEGPGKPQRPMRHERPGHEDRFGQRLNAIKMYKLVELLDLDEEKSAKLATVMKKHREKTSPMMQKFKEIGDKLKAETEKEKPDSRELEKLVSNYTDAAKSLHKEREANEDEILDILTPVQKGKYLLFHRGFPKEFRDNMRDFMKRNIHKFKDKVKKVWPERKATPRAKDAKSS